MLSCNAFRQPLFSTTRAFMQTAPPACAPACPQNMSGQLAEALGVLDHLTPRQPDQTGAEAATSINWHDAWRCEQGLYDVLFGDGSASGGHGGSGSGGAGSGPGSGGGRGGGGN